ncbi:Nitrogen regulation protein NR(I) [Rhodovulum sp. PH10]|uniref:sigma-54-dependent transcriptional regulator n=1 Tax=Rhodovulum sp. PH10 TaxID=1187851 RepID=UPI00027C1F8A|nr:sigma-54 dependent transcriptional regulator [Rhodovulum sp. PH10]EJW13515.1 Nitrogen regulation protein NR(I) [Rhodovulum sp. PH10]
MAERVLIVDDDPVQRRLLEAMVEKFGFVPATADGGDAALALLADPDAPAVDAVVLDLVMPDLDGLGVLAKLRDAGLSLPVIVQTAHGGIDNVVSAMRAGAVDFVVKPVGPERLLVSLRNALATRALEGELSRIKRSRDGTLTFKDVITRSPAMRSVMRAAEKAAASHIPVLIGGESGVGKELFARAIHGSGERRAKPFVAVNCGALPETLVESILFGHEKGAFTGASEKHVGKFVEASGGTLFLDEVGELPAAAQVKLLRAIQESEVEPVGGRKPVKVDVRLMSATNRDLIADVGAGRFREDLFYRLHVFPITLPPLRARAEDIPDLVRHFLLRFAAEEGRRVRRVSAEAVAMLTAYPWPGNVRQLENAIFRAVVLAEGEELGVSEFPQIAAAVARGEGALRVPAAEPADAATAPAPVVAAPRITVGAVTIEEEAPAPPTLPLLDADGNVRPLEDIEADTIRFAIARYGGQMTEVARKLRIGRSTLYRKLETLGPAPADRDGASDVALR